MHVPRSSEVMEHVACSAMGRGQCAAQSVMIQATMDASWAATSSPAGAWPDALKSLIAPRASVAGRPAKANGTWAGQSTGMSLAQWQEQLQALVDVSCGRGADCAADTPSPLAPCEPKTSNAGQSVSLKPQEELASAGWPRSQAGQRVWPQCGMEALEDGFHPHPKGVGSEIPPLL